MLLSGFFYPDSSYPVCQVFFAILVYYCQVYLSTQSFHVIKIFIPLYLHVFKLFCDLRLPKEKDTPAPPIPSAPECLSVFLSILVSLILLLAVFAAVHFLARVGQDEDLIQLLLDGGDAAGILAFHDVADLFGEG